MFVSRLGHIDRILAQKGLAAGKGEVERSRTNISKGSVPLLQGHIIVGFAPDIARLALAVATITDADHNGKGQHDRPIKTSERPIKGEFGE